MFAKENFLQPTADQKSVGLLFAALAPHMRALDEFLREEAARFEPEVQELVRYCLGRGGKRLRPSLVFFAGWSKDASVSPELVKLSAVIELVHLATLVHDDILDSASVRHGRSSAARKFGPETAVLLGDALFSHAVTLSTDFPDAEICRMVSLATRRVCAGEIAQDARRGAADLTVDEYFRLIELKTAELFRVSCHLGARLAGYDEVFCRAAGEFGLNLGIGYQVYDDLTDFFGREEETGKTLGTDLASGKFTLPVILLLEKLDAEGKAAFLRDAEAMEKGGLIDRWLVKMDEEGVLAEVVNTVVHKACEGERALERFGDYPPVEHLGGLTAFLKARVRKMGPVFTKS